MTDHPTAQLFSDFKLHCGEASSAYIIWISISEDKVVNSLLPKTSTVSTP